MSVDNRTPFPAIAFRQYNLAGELLGVVAVRGTFHLKANGPMTLADDQDPLVLADVYDGDPHEGPLLAQSDLVPFKPGTDVTFIGAAHSPDQSARPSWDCRLRVGPLEKRLGVTGPRTWQAKTRQKRGWFVNHDARELDSWKLTDPEPAEFVPIDWRLAYGGGLPGAAPDGPAGRYRFNAIGRGIVDDERFEDASAIPAPQIENLDTPVASPHGEWQPEGFGPISPWWDQRHQYAGTYDEAWLANRHPLLPEDFDFRFWQCAHPDLIAMPWLEGDEDYELENLAYRHALVSGRLPGVKLRAVIDQGNGPKQAPLVLDGVHFDLRPGRAHVHLTWRTSFPWPERRGMPILEQLTEPAAAA